MCPVWILCTTFRNDTQKPVKVEQWVEPEDPRVDTATPAIYFLSCLSVSPASGLGFVHRLVTMLTCLGVDVFYSAYPLCKPSLSQPQLSYQQLNNGPCHTLLWTSDCSKSQIIFSIPVFALTSCTILAGPRGPHGRPLTTA